MIELPPKFKQALGNGVRTSLYPLVRIYQGYRIDDIIPDDAESINLSIKETNIGGSAYKPLLLNTPSIKSSADIVNNKYTISSVSLSISNAPFQGKIFSDDIQSLLNAVCQVYYCANGIDSIGDCLLVYTGNIRRFSQSAETIKLELEDATQQMLSTKIPSSTVPDEEFYKEDDIGKPYPMVYGFVDKSPVISRSLGQDRMGELQQELTKFHIDKRGREVEGLWESPNLEDYGNPLLDGNHPLITNGHIKEVGTLSAYGDNFIPIPQYLDFQEPWAYYVDGITDLDNADYNEVTITVDKIYEFQQTNGYDSSASIIVNAEALINEKDAVGIPTRVYRPIDKVECFTFCDDNPEQGGVGKHSLNKIYGFTGYDIDNTGSWKPWEFSDNVIASTGYHNDWSEGGTFDWWQPTLCNENLDGGETSAIDDNWKDNEWKNSRGLFPVDRLQDGDTDKGMYLCGRNADGERGSPNNYNKSGGAAIKLVLKDNIGSAPCSSKIVYDAVYHSFDSMESSVIGGAGFNRPYYALFWTGENLQVSDEDVGSFLNAEDLIEEHTINNEGAIRFLEFPKIPNITSDWVHQAYNDQSGTEDSVRILNGFGISGTFNNTTAFDNFKFGIPQLKMHGGTQGNDTGYAAVQLFNVYLLQDAVIDQPLDKKFFADIAGRTQNDEVIVSAQNILKDILEDELNYQEGNVELIDEIDSWQNSFTLNEQKEAKEVFEELFKSSLIIPSFNAGGQFTFIPLHQVLDNVLYNTIDNQDLLKYSFSLTKLDDIKNSVNVKYKKNYGSGEFDKETGYKLIDGATPPNEYENLDEITRAIYPDTPTKHYSIDYYGLTSEEAKLEVETDYIRDYDTARKLQKRLLMWYANQHLIAKIDLPASYMNLEVGDYIHFNELIGGKKAFGYDYTISQMKNGQIVYPVFFITKISKSLDKVNIEAIQVHRGEYGEPEDIIIDEENIVDGGGNSGQGNFELGDPNDNPNYGDDTIVEEEPEEEYTEDPYLNVTWVDGNNDLNTNPQAIIDTNIEGEFEYEALIIYNDEVFEYGTNYEMPIITEDDEPYNATDYINVNINTTNNSEGNIQGGNITLSTPYLIPEEHNGIVGILRISYEGTEYTVDFAQGYVAPFVPELGDINADGVVNILDVVMLNHAIRLNTEDELLLESPQADMNNDGILDILDIVILLNLIFEG